MDADAVFNGDWRTIPDTICGGTVAVWDQTVGCPECSINLWYLPTEDQFPTWVHRRPGRFPAIKALVMGRFGDNTYEPYAELFDYRHPFKFADCHDSGDEDDHWAGRDLYVQALIGRMEP